MEIRKKELYNALSELLEIKENVDALNHVMKALERSYPEGKVEVRYVITIVENNGVILGEKLGKVITKLDECLSEWHSKS